MKNRELLIHLIEACKDGKSLAQLHSQILKYGFIDDSFFATKLTSLYAKYSFIELARKLFDETPHRTVYLWNSILRSHCKENKWEETLHLFKDMLSSSSITSDKPDNFSVPIVLKACAGLSELRIGKAIHGFVKKNDKVNSDMFVGSALVELYAKCGEMNDALKVFEEFPEPDIVLWTSMVTGYEQNSNAHKALSFFNRMVTTEGLVPDRVTLISVVSACSQSMNLVAGISVHGFITRMGFGTDLSLVNCLLNLYAKTGSVNNAKNLFENMYEKDVISWSSMISCYVQNEKADEALKLYNEMVTVKRFEPNSVTIVAALQACAAAGNVDEGRRIHDLAIRKGFEQDLSVSTALIDMYMKCSCLEKAVDTFTRMPKKDVVCWAVLISGYAQNGKAYKSLGIFRKMLFDGTRPDPVIMVKVLMACAELGNLQQAHCLHGYLVSSGFDDKVFVGAALIDFYSKCGSLDNSIRVFEGLSEKDVVVWSSMIAGYGIHGLGKEAIGTFNLMIDSSETIPNHVTFLSVLSACSHTGLIEEGIKIFEDMVSTYKIEPKTEHYSVMVDLLGRRGQLDKAMEFIDRMPVPSKPDVWGALLGACRIHYNVEMGETVAKNLFQLDPDHAGYYVLLSNIYAMDKKWGNVAKVRALVKEKGLKRTPGQSSIEVNSRVHTFSVADSSHPESDHIFWMLKEMEMEMRDVHVPLERPYK